MTDFWRAFFDYCGHHELAARLDDLTARVRHARGLPPDWPLEQRRARRAEIKEKLLSKSNEGAD